MISTRYTSRLEFFKWITVLVVALIGLHWTAPAWPQAPATSQQQSHDGVTTAPVIFDGKRLFVVRGVTAFPASQRAERVSGRIKKIAQDHSFSPDGLTVLESGDHTSIMAGDTELIEVYDADAVLEDVSRSVLATVYKQKIGLAIVEYRQDRSGPVLLTNAALAVGLTIASVLLLLLIIRLFRRLDSWAERHVQKNLDNLASRSHQLLHAGQMWGIILATFRGLRLAAFFALGYFYLNTVLGLNPWTRPVAVLLFDLVLKPLSSLWSGFVNSVPDLVFLAILFLVVRALLKLIRAFFVGVARERIKLTNFEADWAMPTFKIIRILVVAFAFVLAYPSIPGSDSSAFKGVSVFLGIIFSLGSTSFIANMMAGLSMTYRGAFKEGDRVMIGDIVGVVDDIKLMVTRIRTAKNESVIVPNSNILNTNVVNYSQLAKEHGLVLHTTVGIGYDTPWRQVEAMLLIAADRTPGLLKEPPPYVLQSSLGDFAVNYELNAYCDKPNSMLTIYSMLHANIQDVFNEHGVQIMSPAYETDPKEPKIVAPDQWYAEPAKKPE